MEDEKERRFNLEDAYYSSCEIIEILEVSLKRIKAIKKFSPSLAWVFALMSMDVREAENPISDLSRSLKMGFHTIAHNNIMIRFAELYSFKETKQMEDEKERPINLEDDTYQTTHEMIETLEASLKRIKAMEETLRSQVWTFALMPMDIEEARNPTDERHRALKAVFQNIAQSNIMLRLIALAGDRAFVESPLLGIEPL